VWEPFGPVGDPTGAKVAVGSTWRAWGPLHFPMAPAGLVEPDQMGSSVGSVGDPVGAKVVVGSA